MVKIIIQDWEGFTIKTVLSLDDVSSTLGVSVDVVRDFVFCGDLPAVGSHKDFVLSSCLKRFINGGTAFAPPVPSPAGSDMFFKDFLKNYLTTIQDGMSSSAFSNLYSHSRHITESLGDYRMNELTRDLIVRFLNSMTVKTYTRGKKGTPQLFGYSIISKIYDFLVNVLQDAWRKNLTIENLSLDLKKPRSRKLFVDSEKELTDAEIRTLECMVAADSMLCVMVYILLYTGMRPSECKALRFSDVDFINKTISVQRTLKREIPLDINTGKRGVPFAVIGNIKNYSTNRRVNHAFRLLTVSDKVLNSILLWQDFIAADAELSVQRSIHHTDDYIFTGVDGSLVVPDYYDQRYTRLLARHGYIYGDFSLYKLRHTFCTRLCRKGVNPKTVARTMGDNTVSMVMEVYNGISKDDVKAASLQYSRDMDFTLSCT